MINNFIYLIIVIFLNQRRMPLYCEMNLFHKIINDLFCWRQDTSTAHIHPITLRTCITRSINDLDYKRLENFIFVVAIKFIFPVFLFPPSISPIVIYWSSFQNIACDRPNFFINSFSCWFQWHQNYKRTWNDLWHEWTKKWMRFLHKSTMIGNCKQLIWEILILFKFLKSFNCYVVAVKKIAFVNLLAESWVFAISKTTFLFRSWSSRLILGIYSLWI